MSQRVTDLNGWFEVPRNPLSKVGIFPYLGRTIGAGGPTFPQGDPNKIYMVYRPAEELADPECLASFRLVPFVDDHTMLGDEEAGLVPADQKGVHGVLGEQVVFDPDDGDGVMFSNLKVFSSSLNAQLRRGKKEVSCGYRCVYDFTPGTFKGKPYDAIQRHIRGNHLALVGEGRMGPDVAVLDHVFTYDAKDATPMDPELLNKIKAALEAALAAIAEAAGGVVDPNAPPANKPGVDTTGGADAGDTLPGGDKDDTLIGDAGADTLPSGDKEDTMAADGKTDTLPAGDATDLVTANAQIRALSATVATLQGRPTVDSAQVMRDISARDALATRLAPHIGAFDHSAMTLSEVAKYGVEKVGLQNVTDGQEPAALEGYLRAKTPDAPAATHAADGADAAALSPVARHIAGVAKP
jgi:hypothetical protein